MLDLSSNHSSFLNRSKRTHPVPHANIFQSISNFGSRCGSFIFCLGPIIAQPKLNCKSNGLREKKNHFILNCHSMCIVECLVENKVQRAEQKIYILRASSKLTSKIEVVSFPGPKGVSRLLTESLKVYEVVLDRSINFELRYSGARPLRDLKTIKGYLDNMLSSKIFPITKILEQLRCICICVIACES